MFRSSAGSKKIITVITAAVIFILSLSVPVSYGEKADRKSVSAENISEIFENVYKKDGSSDLISWVSEKLPEKAGSSGEWYALALLAAEPEGDPDYSNYRKSLLDYVREHKGGAAQTRLKYVLVLRGLGYFDDDLQDIADEATGSQGIMSYIYGLHLMNNGIEIKDRTVENISDSILSFAKSDGGFALTGSLGDVDVTAMTVQALAPYYGKNDDVTAALDAAVSFLSERQDEDGGFSSFGTKNAESCAQVIMALCSLGIDPAEDERFSKNGNDPFDSLLSFRIMPGVFSHIKDGDGNENATIQALLAFISYFGKDPYIFSKGIDDIDNETDPEDTPHKIDDPDVKNGPGYKLYACISVAALFAAAIVILLIIKRFNIKNLLLITGIALLLIIFILATNFQSTGSFYNGAETVKKDPIGTVTLTIDCSKMAGKVDPEYINSDGIILNKAEFAIEEGDTVYDILMEAARKYRIQVDSSGGSMSYIKGINYVYEFDGGDLSGWLYYVNGIMPDRSVSEYVLKDEDEICFVYSLTLGDYKIS